MAENCDSDNGAGEGNRTLVVSLGRLRRKGFWPFLRESRGEHNLDRPGIKKEHRRILPQVYRALSLPFRAILSLPLLIGFILVGMAYDRENKRRWGR